MISRVSAALIKFLAPVSSAAADYHLQLRQQQKQAGPGPAPKEPTQEPPKGPNEKPNQFSQNKPTLKLVPKPEETVAQAVETATPTPSSGVAPAVLQLFAIFRDKTAKTPQWLGLRGYAASLLVQKKAGKFKKGSMFDEYSG